MRRFFDWLSRPARRTNRTILTLLDLERRETPAVGFTATGAAAGTAPVATVFWPSGATLARINAYDPNFLGGVNVAVGEIDGNPNTVEVVTGAGAGGGPHVKVFSVDTLTNAVSTLASFMAYNTDFAGGVNVATGMFGTSTVDQVVTGAGPGGGPHVRVFSVGGGTVQQVNGPLGSFMAFNSTFTGGVNVATGTLDGGVNGDQLVVGAGPGGGPHVRVLDANGTQFASFMAFNPAFTGGVSLGTVGPNQLTVNSLTGGGVTQFAFTPDGTPLPTIVTPITFTTTGGLAPDVVATDLGIGTDFTGLTTDGTTLLATPDTLAVNPVVTGALSTGIPQPDQAPVFNALGFDNVTPAEVAALNGAVIPGVNLLTTNPVVAALALPR